MIRNELTVWYAQIYIPFKDTDIPTHPDNYSLLIKATFWAFQSFFFFAKICWKRLRAYTNDRLCIKYACITCLLYCAHDVNEKFSDVLNHKAADLGDDASIS